jgi:ESF2/ABP1 family protein
MSTRRNEYLDTGLSDSDHEEGYDSEAAEYSKAGAKRRKLSPPASYFAQRNAGSGGGEVDEQEFAPSPTPKTEQRRLLVSSEDSIKPHSTFTKSSQVSKPGVVYLSSLPPYLKPSALRNLLTQRGFSPIRRLFLTPSSKAKNHHSSKKSSRQLYTEGWIEFASGKTAKRCAETLNATTVGGRKGGFYHDDIWNMRYLRGVGWDDLMGQVREERREEEVRRTEERGQIARETKEFIEGVEKGKITRGIERSREKRRTKRVEEAMPGDPENALGDSGEIRKWRQYKVKEGGSGGQKGDSAAISEDVKRVLGKIF